MALRLHPSCENFVDKTIYVWPFHGWGWARMDKKYPESSLEAPAPFLFHVVRLTEHRGLLNGFMGRVEEPQHMFDGLWTVTYLRHGDHCDLVDSIPQVDILLGPQEPFLASLSDDPVRERFWRERGQQPWYPLWEFTGSPRFGGHAELAASREIHNSHLQKQQ